MEKSKKKIAVIAVMWLWLPDEKGPSRFFYIANMLGEMGYDVEAFTGSFEHFDKKQRDIEKLKNAPYPFKITVFDQDDYQKNISIKRLSGYHKISKKLVAELKDRIKEFDAVYCVIPPNDIAAAVGKLCHESGVPFIIDTEDLWPEAMAAVLGKVPGKNIFLSPFKKNASIAYESASACVGTSDEYTYRCIKYTGREIPHETVYVGSDIEFFDNGVAEHSAEIAKGQDEFWAAYAGSIGHTYDIETLVRAARIILDKGYDNIKIKILGEGVLREELEKLSGQLDCSNVEFLGYQPYDVMAAYLVKADVNINMFAKGAPQSIVNKVSDYFAAGRPVLNTLENDEFVKLLEDRNCGISVEAGRPELLAEQIISLYNNREEALKMGANARALAEEKFDRKTSYKAIVKLIEEVSK